MSRPALLFAVILAGCPLEDEVGNLAASTDAARQRMHERFGSARRIEEAIARSDLERARREAHALARLDEPDAQPRWRPYLDAIEKRAQAIESAPDPAEAGRALAMLGRECARCHGAISARLVLPHEQRPASDKRLAPQMLGHEWAAARMWEGLIAPDDDRWNDGALALTQISSTIVAEDASAPRATHTGDDVSRVRMLASRALRVGDADRRAELFGDLLATCAHCHAAIRDR